MTPWASTPLEELTEKQLTTQVVDLARTLGWWRHHHYRSDRSEPGWPDEALLRERLVLLELKTEKGKVSPAQKDVLRRLLDARVEAYLIRPRDLAALAEVLAYRGNVRNGDPAPPMRVWQQAHQLREATREAIG